MSRDFNAAVKNNPLKTRSDFEKCLIDLVTPVYQQMTAENKLGAVHLSDSAAVYDEKRRDVEGFLRTLWGLGPLFSHEEACQKYPQLKIQAEDGIIAGTNPASEFYWGQLNDYDQLFVEMGSLATYLIVTKKSFYDRLTTQQQQNIYNWLNQINLHTIPNTNWLFFRILVNTFFDYIKRPNEQQLTKDLAEIETYYLDDGWYFDGYENQIDYYIPFGMQYYGLLFSILTKDKNIPAVKNFLARGSQFAQTFKDWFVKDGTALPFGRSLTYRFAQSSFFAIASVAQLDYENFSTAESKYLLLQNMRQWFARPIFTAEGFLSIGYGYPNLIMGEGYNAPGSPYWSFKNFIVLLLDNNDSFWQVSEKSPQWNEKESNPYTHQILRHDASGQDLTVFTMGQHSHEHAHGEAKYEKYAYSTTFGFSVAKGSVLPKQGAFDSTLAVSSTENHLQTVFGYDDYCVHENYLYGKWTPFPGTTIETFVIPSYPWHLRLHIINNQQTLFIQGGSFSAPDDGQLLKDSKEMTLYQSSVGTTAALALTDNWQTELQMPEPNTNVLYAKTVLPILKGTIRPGKNFLAAAFLGAGHQSYPLEKLPSYTLNGNLLTFTTSEEIISIHLSEL
ncbi:DUF2264 domain-containing protein [Enterococcus timonensis]|uniref:DUF2264 domain-containing protein n=1 Tax=Enterococcus timonensis TaxID=1852364 RepID=UPI0008D958AF|nr:DUF2264 domain-containing protein [Enterococcus timonensis]